MKRNITKLLFRLLPLTVGILICIEIISINQFASSGHAVHAIEDSITTLKEENSILVQRVASASSLMTIAERVKDMGFVKPTKSQYLTIVPEELPVAYHNPQ
jgi:hypothetical protein